jgi:Flp pilus assembly protein TadD
MSQKPEALPTVEEPQALCAWFARHGRRLGRTRRWLTLRRQIQALADSEDVHDKRRLLQDADRASAPARRVHGPEVAHGSDTPRSEAVRRCEGVYVTYSHGGHYDVGIVLAEAGRRDEARAHYQKDLAINPNAAEVHFNLGSLLQEMGRTDVARTHYLRALAIQPRDAAAHNSLGILLAEMGRTDEAVAHLEQALELEPHHASAHNNLGIVLARKGRTEEAMVHWRKALAIDPGEVGALRNLAFALVERGQWAGATAVVQNALVLARSAGDEARAGMIGEVLAKIRR